MIQGIGGSCPVLQLACVIHWHPQLKLGLLHQPLCLFRQHQVATPLCLQGPSEERGRERGGGGGERRRGDRVGMVKRRGWGRKGRDSCCLTGNSKPSWLSANILLGAGWSRGIVVRLRLGWGGGRIWPFLRKYCIYLQKQSCRKLCFCSKHLGVSN